MDKLKKLLDWGNRKYTYLAYFAFGVYTAIVEVGPSGTLLGYLGALAIVVCIENLARSGK